jgi:hypothetical protein
MKNVNAFIFTQIFSIFNNLKYLNFHPSATTLCRLSFDTSPPTVSSSTVLELPVTLDIFTDCLYLLDGRFNQLHTLHVNTFFLHPSRLTIIFDDYT